VKDVIMPEEEMDNDKISSRIEKDKKMFGGNEVSKPRSSFLGIEWKRRKH